MRGTLIPLGLGAAAMALGAILLAANLLVMATGRSPIKLVPGLTGVTAPDPVPLSLDAMLGGQTEAAYAQAVGRAVPLYPAAVRLRNQVAYSLFGFSPNPTLLVGRDDTVIERAYADEYCARDLARWRPGAAAWAEQIKAMQDEQARRGKAFLYVLTPSKVALYPALLPQGFNCPSKPADRAGLVPEWTAMLRATGVHMVDAVAVLRDADGSYPFQLFPPGGTHWNAVGEALAEQAVLSALARALPGRGLAPLPFTWHMRPHPLRDTDDEDLARLMNLFVPAANGPVPVATPEPATAPASCAPLRIVIIGSSFSHATLRALHALPCPPDATEYEYWHTATLRWDGGGLDKHPGVDPAQRDAAILSADLILFEENEQALSQPSLYGQALSAFLQAPAASVD